MMLCGGTCGSAAVRSRRPGLALQHSGSLAAYSCVWYLWILRLTAAFLLRRWWPISASGGANIGLPVRLPRSGILVAVSFMMHPLRDELQSFDWDFCGHAACHIIYEA